MFHEKLCVLGGGGFVGRHLVSLLASQGRRVWVPSRRPARIKDLTVLPTVELVEADVHEPSTLDRLLQGVDAVVNLVGILHGSPADFQRAHVDLPARIVEACRRQGVARLVHMSALGADPGSRSVYQQTKARGEALVLAAGEGEGGVAVTAFRPSVIFGPGDRFLNLFARLMRLAPAVPLAGAAARFQPVYVGDVARAFALSLDLPETHGRVFPLCGPGVYTLERLVRMAGTAAGVERPILPLGWGASYLFARIMELKPGAKLMTRDNYYAMRQDNVCAEGFPPIFGMPVSLEAAIGYLGQADPRRSYGPFRGQARR
jgi:uncharacterized protein YbjT (DUF2867 family)